jgi:hypothetical protein
MEGDFSVQQYKKKEEFSHLISLSKEYYKI